jgi:hypothetical protein
VEREATGFQDVAMDILLVLMLIAVLGLVSQTVGVDSRGFGGRAASRPH